MSHELIYGILIAFIWISLSYAYKQIQKGRDKIQSANSKINDLYDDTQELKVQIEELNKKIEEVESKLPETEGERESRLEREAFERDYPPRTTDIIEREKEEMEKNKEL